MLQAQKMLRVNLTDRSTSTEEISSKDIEMFLGGRGLGSAMMYRELPGGIDPLDPENKLYYLTGPLTGTTAPGSSRFLVNTKSPLTGCYLMGLSGGYFGPELRKTGFNGVIVEGKASSPVYLLIKDSEVSFRDASKLWGMTTNITEEQIQEEQNDPKIRVSCIGPAGENLGLYAGLFNERRTVGRGGAGAVMGSKNLKAIAVRGSQKVEHQDRKKFMEAVKKSYRELKENPATAKGLRTLGSCIFVEAMNEKGILPWKNFSKNYDPEVNKIMSVYTDFIVKSPACAPPCPVNCAKYMLSREGKYAGAFSDGPEYETVYSFGTCLGIKDLNAIIAWDMLCDCYGLDTMSCGVSIAFATECFERGIITKKDTGGIELRFGESKYISELIRDIAYQQDFGRILALGTKRMAEIFGQGSSDFAMHVKGMEMGGYDPRGAKSMALVFACGSRGGCHHAGGYTVGIEMSGKVDPFANEGKAAITKHTRDRRTAFNDSSIMCSFVGIGVKDETIADMINATVGTNYTVDDLMMMGERINTVERIFNLREGLNPSDDTLPKRLLRDAFAEGPTKGQVVELEGLLTDFYNLCGWDSVTGYPTKERLTQLGLTGKLKI